MKKTLDYLYIFSKFSTSFILLLLLLVLGYFFYLSFKKQEVSNNDQLELINKLNQNVEKLSKLSKKIEITEISLDEIQKSIQKIDNTNQSKEITLLNKKIEELDLSLKNILDNLHEIKTRNISEPRKILSDNISSTLIEKNKTEIIKLVIYKFENNLDFTDELNIFQNISNNKNQPIFEKINLIRLKNFRGNEFLKNIYAQELDFYLKEKFNKNSRNYISKSLMKLVAIEPSKTNIIKNNQINILNEIRNLLDEKNYKISYSKITKINNYENYFVETINQIKIANEFKELINKVS